MACYKNKHVPRKFSSFAPGKPRVRLQMWVDTRIKEAMAWSTALLLGKTYPDQRSDRAFARYPRDSRVMDQQQSYGTTESKPHLSHTQNPVWTNGLPRTMLQEENQGGYLHPFIAREFALTTLPRLTWKLLGLLWKTWFHLQDRPSASFRLLV